MKIYLKAKRGMRPKVSFSLPENNGGPPKADGELMQALFDESHVIAEACGEESQSSDDSIQGLEDEEQGLDETSDDDLYLPDIFAANEAAEKIATKTSVKKKADEAIKFEASKKVLLEAEDLTKAKKTVPKSEAETKPVEANKEFLKQLTEMGFPEDLGKRALIKIKNESVAAAVEAACTIQSEEPTQPPEPKKTEEKKVTLVQWTCERCTVVNEKGGTTCHICFGPAPDSAFIDESAEKEKEALELKAKTEETERLLKEKLAEEEKARAEELARQEKIKHQEKVKSEFENTKKFLEKSEVAGFLFGTINGAKDRRPLVVGAVMANKDEGTADLHLRCLEYRTEYLANFMGSAPMSSRVENRLTQETFPDEASCLKSLFDNNQLLIESLYPALGQ